MTTFCAECGTPVPATGTFCGECGTPVAATAPASAPDNSADTQLGGAVHGLPADGAYPEQVDGDAFDADARTQAMPRAPAAETTPLPRAQGSTSAPYVTGSSAAYPAPAYPAAGYPAAYGGAPGYGPPATKSPAKMLALVALGLVLLAGAFLGTRYFVNDDAETTVQPAATAGATGTATPAPSATDVAAAPAPSGTGGDRRQTEAPTPTALTTPDDHASNNDLPYTAGAPGAGADDYYSLHQSGSGYGGVFDRAGTLTSSTSRSFMTAVAEAYAASGAAGGPVVLDGVYSPTTGKTYRMSCNNQADGSVICSGGNNAKVLLFNDRTDV